MKVPILAILAVILASLACTSGAGFATFTPVPSPSASVSPQPPTLTAAAPTSTEDVQTAIVRQALVNLRDAPEGAVIGTLNAGDTVKVNECSNNWCKVETETQSGYVYQGCLSELAGDRRCEAR